MKKTAHRSEWENIPGFDRIRREYIRLDGEAWLAAHRIRAEGERRGKRNQPGPDETLPDEMYRKIESWVGKRALDCKQEVGKYIDEELANLHELGSSWEEENPEIKIDALVTRRCQDLDAKADQSVSDLDNQRAEYEEAARDLKNFRQRHRLSRVAHYPSHRVAHWLWILAAVLIETIVGGILLGSVSRGGVIEGWTVAVGLTVVNVFLGILTGWIWRWTHYDSAIVKGGAYTLTALFAAVALVWNDMAGHVRDVYVLAEKTGAIEAIDGAFATAWRTMFKRPLPWESVQSAWLAIVGIAVFGLTTYKRYTADDSFPGYGMRHRKVEALHGRYQDGLNDALDELRSARNEANEVIDEIKSRYEMDRAGWENALDRLRMIVDDYSVNLRQYNKDLAYLLAAYRDANLGARTDPPPPFFGIEPTIDEHVVQPPEFRVPAPPEWGNIPKKAKEGFAQVEKTYDRLRPRYKMLDRVVDDYAEDAP